MKSLRCSAEMEFLRYCYEITKMSKFDVGHDLRFPLGSTVILIIRNMY